MCYKSGRGIVPTAFDWNTSGSDRFVLGIAAASSRMESEHFFSLHNSTRASYKEKFCPVLVPFEKLELCKILAISPLWTFSGDGRSRTAVQTSHQIAFYTFIHPLIVGSGLPNGGLTGAYPLSLGGV